MRIPRHEVDSKPAHAKSACATPRINSEFVVCVTRQNVPNRQTLILSNLQVLSESYRQRPAAQGVISEAEITSSAERAWWSQCLEPVQGVVQTRRQEEGL
jgi:hypothetical protein